MARSFLLGLLVAVVGLAAFADASCVYNGHTYEDGQGFKSSDGCNSCGCNHGAVLCTMRACLQLPLNRGSCHYGGHSYKEGETFTATDGCNVCTCRLGTAICSKIGCLQMGR